MVTAIFDCVEILLQQRNREYMTKPEEYVIPRTSDLVQQESTVIITALDTVSYTLNNHQLPGDIAKEVVSDQEKILARTKVDFAGGVSEWTTTSQNCSVLVTNKSMSSLGNTSELIGLQYILMRINPFWWAGGNIVSEVLLVNICKRTKLINCVKETRFKHFVTLRLNVIESLDALVYTNGTAYQVDPKTTEELKELKLTVYRIFIPERAKLFIKFIVNDTRDYRVTVVEGIRPDHTAMLGDHKVINATSPHYNVTYDVRHAYENVYFMAILPGKEVKVGETAPFRFQAYYSLCNTWVRWQWTSFGCFVGAKTEKKAVYCDCDHLSVVGGTIKTPDHDLSTVEEFLLYLTPWENLLPLFILLIILFVYLLLMIWAFIQDRRDKRRGEVIVLYDNFPGETYAYLLGVYTGSRILSGTTAAVGVRLFGDDGDTRSHILTSPDRKVLKTFSEDWFLIYSTRHIGKIRRLWLWHNDGGCCPDWFVDKIEVYDLKTKVQYIFEINSWVAMDVDTYPDIYVAPIKVDEYLSSRNIFRYNFCYGMRDSHNWTSVCLKHSRNPISRVDRVNVLMCFVLTALAVCLLLYFSHFGFNIDEDKPSYYLANIDLWIFILTLIAASIVACLMMILFRKSFTHKYKIYSGPREIVMSHNKPQPGRKPYSESDAFSVMDEKESVRNPSSAQTMFRKFGDHEKPLEMTTYEKWVMAAHKIAQGNFLLPVRLQGSKSDLIVRKCWFIIAWAVCAIIIVICILTVLYYAWRLPTVKDNKFLTTFFAVVIFDAVILSFIKIVLFSALLSCMFHHILSATTYHINVKRGRRNRLFGDKPFLMQLLKTREQRIYYALPEAVKEHRRQNKIRKHRWRLVIDFLMLVIVLCIICVIFSIHQLNLYESNSHAAQMISTSESISIPDLHQVFNRTELYDFLENTYVSLLFYFMWYNYEPLIDPRSTKKDWTRDCVMRLVGNTRIRQLRVSKDNCYESYFRDSVTFCAPPWSNSAEDRDVYSTSWGNPDREDYTRRKSTWRYTEAGSSNSSRFYGLTGTLYHAGGYIEDLGYSKRSTRGSLLTLEMEGWLDHMTRAAFVELTMYNVNTGLFTQVVLIFEHLSPGQYVPRVAVESATVHIHFDFWLIGFIVFHTFFLFRVLFYMNRHGVITYMSSVVNKFEIFVVVLGFAAVILYMVQVHFAKFYVEEYHRRGLDEFFNFFEIVRFNFSFKAAMYLLLFCLVLELLVFWRFGKIFFTFYYTFLLSLTVISWLTPTFIFCLIILWRCVGYSVNVYVFSHFSTAILHHYSYPHLTQASEGRTADVVVYLLCIMSIFQMILFVAFLAHLYRVARFYNAFVYKNVKYFHYVTFLKKELNRLRGK